MARPACPLPSPCPAPWVDRFVLGQTLGHFPAPGASGPSKPLGAISPDSVMWTLKDNNPSDFIVRDVIIYHRVWDRAVHNALAVCIL